jgi:transcriptional regulator with XRE-family HTH domain
MLLCLSLGLEEGSCRLAKKRDTFATRLTALREKAGITMYRLAQLTGISKQTIGNLERGAIPSWDTVQLLAHALGVSCEVFVTGDVVPPEPPPVKRPGPKSKRR